MTLIHVIKVFNWYWLLNVTNYYKICFIVQKVTYYLNSIFVRYLFYYFHERTLNANLNIQMLAAKFLHCNENFFPGINFPRWNARSISNEPRTDKGVPRLRREKSCSRRRGIRGSSTTSSSRLNISHYHVFLYLQPVRPPMRHDDEKYWKVMVIPRRASPWAFLTIRSARKYLPVVPLPWLTNSFLVKFNLLANIF